jgi:uncharacterized protein
MSSSLRDQLIAAGLVTERQAKQARQEQARQFKARRPPDNAAKNAAQQAQAAKAARDQELAQRQQEKAERKARRAQVNQMVEQVALPKVASDDSYSFVDGTTIRRIPITAELRNRLTAGELAIARFRGSYALVPSEAVRRIRECDEHAVIALDAGAKTVDPNDPYKDFVVPDDLTW